MSNYPSITSNRLVLKELTKSHCTGAYLKWLHDKDVNKFLEKYAFPSESEDLWNYVENVKSRDTLFFAIHLKETDVHIGNIKIDPINRVHGVGEYGILMGEKKFWGQGYAKEASIAIINYCFEKLRLRKVTLGVVEDNISAVKLYDSIGFEIEGKYIDHGFYDGKLCNVLRMAIFNHEYKAE